MATLPAGRPDAAGRHRPGRRLRGPTSGDVCTARGSCSWPGRATTAATPCRQAPGWPDAASRSTPSLLGVDACTSRARRRCGAPAGGSSTEPDWRQLRPRARRHRRHRRPAGLDDRAAAAVVDGARLPGRRGRCAERHRRRHRPSSHGPHVQRRPDRDVRHAQDRPARRPGRRRRGVGRAGRHRARALSAAIRCVEVLRPTTSPACCRCPTTASHKYSRGVLGVAAGSEQYVGAGLLATSAAVESGFAGMVRYEGASADLIRAAHPEVVIGSGQVQAWVVGSGDRRRPGLARRHRSWPRACRPSSMPTACVTCRCSAPARRC